MSSGKCAYCRAKLTSNNTEKSTDSKTCIKCCENEQKYGKPTTCMYCCLPAAFRQDKCVYCSHSERKRGAPINCSNCKLKAAFPDPTERPSKNLCRLCLMSYTSNVEKVKESKNRKRKRKLSTSDNGNNDKSTNNTPNISKQTNSLFENCEEQIMVVSQLKDQVANLQKQLVSKDFVILEKDKKIAFVNAQMLMKDKDHRKKVQSIAKQNEDSQICFQTKILNLSRQVASLSKGKRVPYVEIDNTNNNSPM